MRNVRVCQNLLKRCYTTGASKNPATSVPSADSVKGLSSNCVKPASGPVGPGATPNGQYKVPEYFCFNRFSFHEAEVEMAKYRCPQPSALKK